MFKPCLIILSLTHLVEVGLGFASQSYHVKRMVKINECLSDRLLSMLFLLSKRKATLISVNAPTVIHNCIIDDLPHSEKLLAFGDFSIRVGSDNQAWSGVIGKHGLGKSNNFPAEDLCYARFNHYQHHVSPFHSPQSYRDASTIMTLAFN